MLARKLNTQTSWFMMIRMLYLAEQQKKGKAIAGSYTNPPRKEEDWRQRFTDWNFHQEEEFVMAIKCPDFLADLSMYSLVEFYKEKQRRRGGKEEDYIDCICISPAEGKSSFSDAQPSAS